VQFASRLGLDIEKGLIRWDSNAFKQFFHALFPEQTGTDGVVVDMHTGYL
jgi:hypothetical protein